MILGVVEDVEQPATAFYNTLIKMQGKLRLRVAQRQDCHYLEKTQPTNENESRHANASHVHPTSDALNLRLCNARQCIGESSKYRFHFCR